MDHFTLNRPFGWAGTRQAALVLASLGALWLLYGKLAEVDPQAVVSLVLQFPPSVWLAGAAFTAVSLIAVGGYDVAVARWLELPLTRRQAFSVGWKATAIAQTLGFGLFTGSLVRWRLLGQEHGITLWKSSKITAIVTACFFGGWTVVGSVAAVLTPDLPPRLWWLGVFGLWAAFCGAVVCLRAAALRGVPLPPLRMSAQVTALTALDTLAAAAVIYCFLPEGYAPFLILYSAFLVAFAVGMVSTVPGGVGPFELCLVSLLAPTDPTPLLAACLAYRAVYYLAPALIAALALIRPQRRAARPASCPASPRARAQATAQPLPHRAALMAQGQVAPIVSAGGVALGHATANTEILLFDPEGRVQDFLASRLAAARALFRAPVLYKCSGVSVQAATQLGFKAHRIACEAVLRPQNFTPDGPRRAELRRKLRKAEKAGIKIIEGLPRWRHLQTIDAAWQARNGAPLGFSMGTLEQGVLTRQRVFTACQDGIPLAFVSFHVSPGRWTLDLMRSSAEAPDGTMHALVTSAIGAARAQGVERLSLCSVPLHLDAPARTWLERLVTTARARSSVSHGLYRFKSSFAPDWHAQYIAGPSTVSLLIAAYEIYRLIHAGAAPRDTQPEPNKIQDHYDLYEFASNPTPWQTGL